MSVDEEGLRPMLPDLGPRPTVPRQRCGHFLGCSAVDTLLNAASKPLGEEFLAALPPERSEYVKHLDSSQLPLPRIMLEMQAHGAAEHLPRYPCGKICPAHDIIVSKLGPLATG